MEERVINDLFNWLLADSDMPNYFMITSYMVWLNWLLGKVRRDDQ